MRPENKPPPKVDVWLAEDGWRWRVVARNGRIRAESGEAYTRRADAVKAYEALMVDAPLTVEQE
jgi:uncharacterized protein YegP (UPF0339 family)